MRREVTIKSKEAKIIRRAPSLLSLAARVGVDQLEGILRGREMDDFPRLPENPREWFSF